MGYRTGQGDNVDSMGEFLLFKGKEFWQVERKMGYPWAWNALLLVRDAMLEKLEAEVRVDGRITWKIDYTVKQGYEMLKEKKQVVSWAKMVWSNDPRQSFMMCTMLLHKSHTNNKQMQWGILYNDTCELL